MPHIRQPTDLTQTHTITYPHACTHTHTHALCRSADVFCSEYTPFHREFPCQHPHKQISNSSHEAHSCQLDAWELGLEVTVLDHSLASLCLNCCVSESPSHQDVWATAIRCMISDIRVSHVPSNYTDPGGPCLSNKARLSSLDWCGR